MCETRQCISPRFQLRIGFWLLMMKLLIAVLLKALSRRLLSTRRMLFQKFQRPKQTVTDPLQVPLLLQRSVCCYWGIDVLMGAELTPSVAKTLYLWLFGGVREANVNEKSYIVSVRNIQSAANVLMSNNKIIGDRESKILWHAWHRLIFTKFFTGYTTHFFSHHVRALISPGWSCYLYHKSVGTVDQNVQAASVQCIKLPKAGILLETRHLNCSVCKRCSW